MDYPTFKIKGSPTPNDKLIVCDECKSAAWTIHTTDRVHQCHNCPSRMREATPAEYVKGKAAVKQVIG